jgi:hypothetical protein
MRVGEHKVTTRANWERHTIPSGPHTDRGALLDREPVRGRSAEERRAVRQAETKPLVEKLKAWLENRRTGWSPSRRRARSRRRFLEDGRIELDTNSVERAMRPIALNRKTVYSPATTPVRQIGPASHP